ncbi:MAG: DUF167 domain-containing protein [Patescibacteria group bacterium]
MKTVRIRVHPNSKQEKCWKDGERYEIFVKAKAKEGRANEEALNSLSKILHVPLKNLFIIRGQRSPQKTVAVGEREGAEGILPKNSRKRR